jgi:hypothetical protein
MLLYPSQQGPGGGNDVIFGEKTEQSDVTVSKQKNENAESFWGFWGILMRVELH